MATGGEWHRLVFFIGPTCMIFRQS